MNCVVHLQQLKHLAGRLKMVPETENELF